MIPPRTPSGTLELLPKDQLQFARMQRIIQEGFERFGFLPIETPVFEYSDILLNKSGGETEKQVYFVQSTGSLNQARAQSTPAERPELALRFDLTVPLARYVAQYENQLVFPFRRYQIQRVYRGERNQRGRYREFYQCDIDVVGKDQLPLAFDAEMPAVINEVFKALNFGPFTIRINNRKLLNGLLRSGGIDNPQRRAMALREIDKLEKIGHVKVEQALAAPEIAMASDGIKQLLDFLFTVRNIDQMSPEMLHPDHPISPVRFASRSVNDFILEEIPKISKDEMYLAGIRELKEVVEAMDSLGVTDNLAIDLSIARGLDYYTGTIYETTLNDFPGIGSVCSGGRYDDLAGLYTRSKLPGVGLSIGLTRLYFQLKEAGRIGEAPNPCAVYVTMCEPSLAQASRAIATELRQKGINVELAPEPQKLQKQLKYADRVGIQFVIIYGEPERERNAVALKDLRTNQQVDVPRTDLAQTLLQKLKTTADAPK